MKTFIIDGNNFNDLEGFYDEVQRELCPSFKGFGRNLDAFNDVLWGGFLAFEYEEPIKLIWVNSTKSKWDLGLMSTLNALEEFYKSKQPYISREEQNRIVRENVEQLKATGHPTIYDRCVAIIKDHDHINFIEQ